jgi:hypothetical protein
MLLVPVTAVLVAVQVAVTVRVTVRLAPLVFVGAA